MPNTIIESLWMFLIYAFLGWCLEVCYVGLEKGHFVNRGFLNGPYCPIYGCGILLVVYFLNPLKDNLIFLFIGSMVISTILEYITGYLLDKFFNRKWWDYSNMPFNIKGYVCAKFSMMWGIGCFIVIKIIHPIILKAIQFINRPIGNIFLYLFIILFIIDLVVTIQTALHLNRKLDASDEIVNMLHNVSDDIGEDVYEAVVSIKTKRKAIKKKKNQLVEKLHHYGMKRILKAFPDILENIKKK